MSSERIITEKRIEYQIFKLSEDGLLKRPMKSDYGHPYPAFGSYKTMDEALEAIAEAQKNYEDGGAEIILPVAVTEWEYT